MTKYPFVIALVALTALAPIARGADIAAKGREILKKNQSSVVTVQLVVRNKINFPGLGGGDDRESRQEITGTVIDDSGLTVVSLSSTDPMSLMEGFMGMFGGGDEEDALKMKMGSELSDIKLLAEDGTELPAEIVLRDKDLDLAFVRPKSKPADKMAFLDLSNNAKVDVLDEVVTLNRLGKVANRAYAASIERISAVVQRPRLFYVPGSDKTATGLGSPAFTLDGKIVGIFVMRLAKSSSGGAGAFSFQDPPVTAILIPADEVKKVAGQIAPKKKDDKE